METKGIEALRNRGVIDAAGVTQHGVLSRVVLCVLVGLSLLAGTNGVAAQDLTVPGPIADPSVTYLGNAGVFISYAGHGVLIDALVRRGIPPYVTAPADVREKLERAESPFDDVDLVL
ncbi:MAG: hypothetical protein OER90_15610, partial [Gemmatimonadota bacterium]|nr:hypothetical protein [Gemmatimonadota bacterium]